MSQTLEMEMERLRREEQIAMVRSETNPPPCLQRLALWQQSFA